jgi:hypothetical protein
LDARLFPPLSAIVDPYAEGVAFQSPASRSARRVRDGRIRNPDGVSQASRPSAAE